ncbi:FMN-dependent NADH-azoreductase, partial [Corallococcus exercitus]
DQGMGTGPVDSLHAQEARLRTLPGANVLVLRAGSFFENFFDVLPVIRHQGVTADVVEPERPVPMIATRDIADAAVTALRARDWQGFVVRELLGPRDLSYAEATRILGERIGQPELPYVKLPPDEMAGALVQGGFSADLARLYVELAQAINDGRVRSLEGRTPANTTPTRFEDFADELARAYAAM